MSEFNADQELVLDIMKQWLQEQDASFLAKEEQIVHWGPLEGNQMRMGWVKYKLREALNIIRTLRVPVGIMKYCTEDLLRAAAQEEGRAYICGVETYSNHTSPDYFNFHKYGKATCITKHHEIAVGLIQQVRMYDENIKWLDLVYLYEQSCKYCGMPVPVATKRNGFLRYAITQTDFIERNLRGKVDKRYQIRYPDGKEIRLTCIKLDHKSGYKKEWSKEEMRNVVIQATKAVRAADNRAAKQLSAS